LVIRAFNATDVGRCTPSDDDLMSDGHRCAGWVRAYYDIICFLGETVERNPGLHLAE